MTEPLDADRWLEQLRARTEDLPPPPHLLGAVLRATRPRARTAIVRLAPRAIALAALTAAAMWLVVLHRSTALAQVVVSEALEGPWH